MIRLKDMKNEEMAEQITAANSHPLGVWSLGETHGCSVSLRHSISREGGCA
jgi:hypothetical protein